ncbi:hypothetical protein GCM10020256_12990 [Streptomyces thermocoprophilus]
MRLSGGEADVGAADDGRGAGAGAQLVHGLVEGDEGAGAGGVDGEAGSAEVEVAADRGRGHVEQAARQGEGVQGAGPPFDVRAQSPRQGGIAGGVGVVEQFEGADARGHEVLVVGDRQGDEDAGGLPVEAAPSEAGVVEGFAGDVEHQPVLRVHGLRAARRQPVVQGGEPVDAVEEGDPVGVGGVGGRTGRRGAWKGRWSHRSPGTAVNCRSAPRRSRQ